MKLPMKINEIFTSKKNTIQYSLEMDETKVLERALHCCHRLENYLKNSIKMVRRLNIRYNTAWMVTNYRAYVANIWLQHCQPKFGPRIELHTPPPREDSPMQARSANEVFGSSRRINYKFIKIKRSIEALIVQVQRAIDIANRQKLYVHMNVNTRKSRTRLCFH